MKRKLIKEKKKTQKNFKNSKDVKKQNFMNLIQKPMNYKHCLSNLFKNIKTSNTEFCKDLKFIKFYILSNNNN